MQTLQFNVAQLLKESTGATREYELADNIAGLTEDVEVLAPLKGNVKFVRTNDGILVTGTLSTVVKLLCSRCAQDYLTKIDIELEDTFYPTFDVTTGYKIPAEEQLDSDPATLIDQRHLLDLSEVIRQDLLIAVPPYPVCRADCAGLCAQCGKDLNEGPCGCEQQEINPSWSKLQTLLDSESDQDFNRK